MSTQRLMSKGDFARACNVTYATIRNQCESKYGIKSAMVGDAIDANHPDAVSYLNRCWGLEPKPPAGTATIKNARKTKDRPPLPIPEQLAERATPTPQLPMPDTQRGVPPVPYVGGTLDNLPEDVRRYADWPLRDLIAHFGSDYAFVDWLKAYKQMEDIHAKQLANMENEGRLVSRTLVEKVVFANIETMTVRLLTDGSKTISRKVYEMAKAGRTVEECERFVADQITSFIAPAKDKMKKGI